MGIPQTSSLLSLDDVFFSLHVLSGDLCLLAKIWWLMWCWCGQCLVWDYIWLTPVKIQVDARTTSTGPAAWLSPHLWKEMCQESWDWHYWVTLQPAVHSNSVLVLQYSYCHFFLEITFQRRFWYMGGNVRKIGWSWCKGSLTAKDWDCEELPLQFYRGTCLHDTDLNLRQCLFKSQTSNSRSWLPGIVALQENNLFSVL